MTLSAVYCPPPNIISTDQFTNFFSPLGCRFIAGGDYNAKHQSWGSRLTTPRGRELFRAIKDDQLETVSSGEPTYWPSDRNKIPEPLDFLCY